VWVFDEGSRSGATPEADPVGRGVRGRAPNAMCSAGGSWGAQPSGRRSRNPERSGSQRHLPRWRPVAFGVPAESGRILGGDSGYFRRTKSFTRNEVEGLVCVLELSYVVM